MLTPSENIKIYQDTLREFTTGKYQKAPHQGSFVMLQSLLIPMISKYPHTQINIVNLDTFTCCQQLLVSHPNNKLVALNFASPSHAGGGVARGALAQEEDLFRRSNYYFVLSQKLYPMADTTCIYSPQIIITKDKHYQPLSTTYCVSMIASAALRHPKLTSDGHYALQSNYDQMKAKIRHIFQVAYKYEHDTLVLGAYGLGAFKNSVNDVIQIFNEVIQEYYGCFKLIVFPIIDNQQTHNYQHFNQHIKRNYINL